MEGGRGGGGGGVGEEALSSIGEPSGVGEREEMGGADIQGGESMGLGSYPSEAVLHGLHGDGEAVVDDESAPTARYAAVGEGLLPIGRGGWAAHHSKNASSASSLPWAQKPYNGCVPLCFPFCIVVGMMQDKCFLSLLSALGTVAIITVGGWVHGGRDGWGGCMSVRKDALHRCMWRIHILCT